MKSDNIKYFFNAMGRNASRTLTVGDIRVGRPWDLYWDYKSHAYCGKNCLEIVFKTDTLYTEDIALKLSILDRPVISERRLVINTDAGCLMRPGYDRKWSTEGQVVFTLSN
jgi:hypothetical protein